MMPVEFTPEWLPLQRFSVIGFGEAIGQYVESGVLSVQKGDAKPADADYRTHYGSEDLDCDVFTIGGLVHEIRTSTVCQFNGMNIVGSNVEAALECLNVRSVEWLVPEPDDPLERIGVVLTWGVELWVVNANQTIAEVTLHSAVRDHRAREYWAKRHVGGLVESWRSKDTGRPIPPAYDIG